MSTLQAVAKIYLLPGLLFLLSCRNNNASEGQSPQKGVMPGAAAVSHRPPVTQAEGQAVRPGADTAGSETVTCFVVIADSSRHYKTLLQRMLTLHHTLGQEIDTLERTYNSAKDLIALPDDHPDEIYAGDYSPRRYPTSSLSIEYLSFYQEKAGEKTMALVAGIYEEKSRADSALRILKGLRPGAYMAESKIYMGCIH